MQGFRLKRKCGTLGAHFWRLAAKLAQLRRLFDFLSVGANTTMAVDRSDIAKLAKLARIQITDEAADEAANSISEVLALVDQLQAVNTDGVLPMAHPLDAVQRLRADVVTEPNQREAFQAIAPATQDGLYLVPQVIE
jgi:aspartyl-tRNA(Asn)/glutamyl-tRNA(Gln) amidotransferase subunit C